MLSWCGRKQHDESCQNNIQIYKILNWASHWESCGSKYWKKYIDHLLSNKSRQSDRFYVIRCFVFLIKCFRWEVWFRLGGNFKKILMNFLFNVWLFVNFPWLIHYCISPPWPTTVSLENLLIWNIMYHELYLNQDEYLKSHLIITRQTEQTKNIWYINVVPTQWLLRN